MRLKTMLGALLVTAGLLAGSGAEAQTFVRLQPDRVQDTLSSNGDSVVLTASRVGGFGSVKVQTLDSYTGTWEVQCSANGTTYDADNELAMTLVDNTTVVYSVDDTVGVWDVSNASGCASIRVIATGGFAASDTVVVISATQTGGGSGSGGGGGGGGAVTVTDGSDTALVSAGGELLVSCADCSGSGVSHIDDAAFAPTTDDVVPIAGVLDDVASDAVNEGDAGAIRMSSNRNLFTVLRDAAGNERGVNVTAGNALTVDGSAVTQPISGTVTITDGAGAVNVICDSGCLTADADDASLAPAQTTALALALTQVFDGSVWRRAPGNATDGLTVNLGSNNDVTVTGTVTANLSATDNAVLDDIADGIAVTATNLDVQSGGADLATESTAAGILTSANFAAAFGTAGTADTQVLSVQGIASGTALTVSDGSGALNVICDSGCSGGTQYAEDAAHASGNTGTLGLGVRNDAGTALAADGNNIPAMYNSAGSLYAVLTASTANVGDFDLEYAGTAAATGSGVTGSDVLRVDIATDSALVTSSIATAGFLDTLLDSLAIDTVHGQTPTDSGPPLIAESKTIDGSALPNAVTEGQGIRVASTIYGSLLTTLVHQDGLSSPIVNEDVASAAAEALLKVGGIRDDTLDARSATEGDWEMFHMNANGALWAIDVNSAAALTSTQLLDDAVFTDDAAYTPATSKGYVIMGQADDTSTDSIDEGDAGALRISLDRLLYTRTADPCSGGATKLFLPFDITTATTTEITPSLAGASTHYYICALNIVTTAANNVNLVDDNSDNCASVTASLISTGLAAGDGWGFGANGGMTLGNGAGTVMRTQTANSVLCLVTSAATELHGQFVVVAAP